MATKLNSKIQEITGIKDLHGLAIHLMDPKNSGKDAEIINLVNLLSTGEQKYLVKIINDCRDTESSSSVPAETSIVKDFYLERAKQAHKISLNSISFAQAIKKELNKILPDATTYTPGYVDGIGKVLYIKNKNAKTLAICQKYKGELKLTMKLSQKGSFFCLWPCFS